MSEALGRGSGGGIEWGNVVVLLRILSVPLDKLDVQT